MEKAMTIYEIAKMANVSPATVSRVLNNKPGVSFKKRELIHQLIKDHYDEPRSDAEPNPDKEEKTVAILTDDPDSEYQSIGLAICQNELLKAGYQSVSRCIAEGISYKTVFEMLKNEKVCGILMMGYSFTRHALIHEMITEWFSDIPVILVRQISGPQFPNLFYVGTNERKGIADCVDALIKKDRSNLALVLDKRLGEKNQTRYYFEQALLQYEGIRYCYYDDAEYSIEGGRSIAARLMREHPETDGILCIRDRVAIGLLYGLAELGKKVPEEISIIGKDNSKLCEASNPPMTALDTQLRDCIIMGIHLLLDTLDHRITTHRLLLDMNLVERGTL